MLKLVIKTSIFKHRSQKESGYVLLLLILQRKGFYCDKKHTTKKNTVFKDGVFDYLLI